MSKLQALKNEIINVGIATLYFAVWLGVLVTIKKLLLAEYDIKFEGLSAVLVGSLVLAKVVLIMEHIPLGAWLRTRPAWVDVFVRTALYTLGVFIVILLEKAFEGRGESGGFVPALRSVLHHAQGPHVLANTICLSGALLSYNMLSVIKRSLGKGTMIQLFLAPLPEEPKTE